MNKVRSVLVATGISLALQFTFSCSSNEGDPVQASSSSTGTDISSSSSVVANNPSSSSNAEILSSSSLTISSSSSATSNSSSGELPSSSSIVSSSSSQQQSSSSSIHVGSGGKGNDISNYRIIQIGTQIWMAENLNYDVFGSQCYDNLESNCDIYGRLYDWTTAMVLPSSCNSSYCESQISAKHRGICPEGWHIPSISEWKTLERAVGGFSTAGTKLKATSGWKDYNGHSCNGTDDYGFSALPSGYGYNRGDNFGYAGYLVFWWTSSEYDYDYKAIYFHIEYDRELTNNHPKEKEYMHSIRCLKD